MYSRTDYNNKKHNIAFSLGKKHLKNLFILFAIADNYSELDSSGSSTVPGQL